MYPARSFCHVLSPRIPKQKLLLSPFVLFPLVALRFLFAITFQSANSTSFAGRVFHTSLCDVTKLSKRMEAFQLKTRLHSGDFNANSHGSVGKVKVGVALWEGSRGCILTESFLQ